MTQFSRLPVYEDSIDNIVGILSLTKYYKATLDDPIPTLEICCSSPASFTRL